MPETAAARDLIALAERGDLGGASFGFNVPKDGDAWTGNSRELRNVHLADVSIVSAWPAYQDTEIALRVLKPANQLAAMHLRLDTAGRSEERRRGKVWVRTCRSRGTLYHFK